MGKPISDAQIYGLLWAAECTYGAFSELMDPPYMVKAPDGRFIELRRTAFDRLALLGLGRRGLMVDRSNGLWEITDTGRAEIRRLTIAKRITRLADETAADQKRRNEERE